MYAEEKFAYKWTYTAAASETVAERMAINAFYSKSKCCESIDRPSGLNNIPLCMLWRWYAAKGALMPNILG